MRLDSICLKRGKIKNLWCLPDPVKTKCFSQPLPVTNSEYSTGDKSNTAIKTLITCTNIGHLFQTAWYHLQWLNSKCQINVL